MPSQKGANLAYQFKAFVSRLSSAGHPRLPCGTARSGNALVEQRRIPTDPRGASEVRFTLDLRRAVAMQNNLSARLSLAGVDQSGAGDPREDSAEALFITHPPDRTWWDYQIIMWQAHTAAQYATLKKVGITAGAAVYRGQVQSPPASFLQTDLRWYVENIATDFYSAYHRVFPAQPKNW